MNPRVLIDASNLRVGGGVQVAASFLGELDALREDPPLVSQYPWLKNITIEISSVVAQNLKEEIKERLPISVQDSRTKKLFAGEKYDLCFTVFGPTYGAPRAKINVAGFADGTSLWTGHPQSASQTSLPLRAKSIARRAISREWFRRMDRIVVEGGHVRRDLHKLWGIDSNRIDIANNCVNQEILSSHTPPSQEKHGFCYVTRNYPHKNLRLLGQIGKYLESQGVTDVFFTLTLTEMEWKELDSDTRYYCTNMGPVLVNQVREIYEASEGAVFPSLLESSSASPLEALATGTPLVASDREFVREMCYDAPIYADPLDPEAWGKALLQARDPRIRTERVRRGYEVFESAATSRDRAIQYIDTMDQALRGGATNT